MRLFRESLWIMGRLRNYWNRLWRWDVNIILDWRWLSIPRYPRIWYIFVVWRFPVLLRRVLWSPILWRVLLWWILLWRVLRGILLWWVLRRRRIWLRRVLLFWRDISLLCVFAMYHYYSHY